MIKKAIGYYRISSNGQEDNSSLEEQRVRVRAFCKSQNLDIAKEFNDIATGGDCNRSGYQAALEYLEEHPGKIASFVVYKLDRAHRHQQNLLVFESNLRDKKISLVSASELIDTNTPQGKLMFQILGSFAEFEKNTIVERTRDGRKAKLKNMNAGESAGGRPPYGYSTTWQQIPEEAENVGEFFRQYLRLRSLGRLQKWAESKGFISRQGKIFSRQALHLILKNRAYLGEYGFDGQREGHGKIVKKHHKRIIACSTFGKVQKALQRGRK